MTHVRPAEMGRSAEICDGVLLGADVLDHQVVHLVITSH